MCLHAGGPRCSLRHQAEDPAFRVLVRSQRGRGIARVFTVLPISHAVIFLSTELLVKLLDGAGLNEQGKADATRDVIAKSKNISSEGRKTAPDDIYLNGFKVKAVSGVNSSKLKIKRK